jgi:uncharacterized protein involved in outer membrane biogenesis
MNKLNVICTILFVLFTGLIILMTVLVIRSNNIKDELIKLNYAKSTEVENLTYQLNQCKRLYIGN